MSSSKKRMLISYSFSDSIISEQFRNIHANIKFSMSEQKSRIILITSPGIGEGKSSSVSNLAVSMALQNERVLLIDANLRTPSLHSYFKVPNKNGLTEFITGKIPFEESVIHTEIGKLDLLTSGQLPYNPIELIDSPMMRELLIKALNTYDVVLIDSYAVLEVTDTKLLASQCDGVVLVIKSGKTKAEYAAESKKVLEFAKAKVIGAIITE